MPKTAARWCVSASDALPEAARAPEGPRRNERQRRSPESVDRAGGRTSTASVRRWGRAEEPGNRESCRHPRTNHEPRELTRHCSSLLCEMKRMVSCNPEPNGGGALPSLLQPPWFGRCLAEAAGPGQAANTSSPWAPPGVSLVGIVTLVVPPP